MVKVISPNRKIPKYPRISKKVFTRWNEKMFEKYNNERVYKHPNLFIRLVENQRLKVVINSLGPINNSDYILAAGCGEGYIEARIKNGKLLMVDLSKEAIKRAKKNNKDRNNIKYLVADLERLPVKDGVFDKIECSEVIEHVYSPKKMLSEFYRVLKEDGVMVISFPNEPLINSLKKVLAFLYLFDRFFPDVPRDMTEEWHLRSMDILTFKKMSKKNWRIESVKKIPHSFLPIRFVVTCKKIRS